MAVKVRRQLPTESACSYVIEKLKICKLSPTALTEEQMIPFLIRGFVEGSCVVTLGATKLLECNQGQSCTELERVNIKYSAPS